MESVQTAQDRLQCKAVSVMWERQPTVFPGVYFRELPRKTILDGKPPIGQFKSSLSHCDDNTVQFFDKQ